MLMEKHMMTQSVQAPRASREPRTYGLLLAVLSLSLVMVTGCSDSSSSPPQGDETVSATIVIHPEDFFSPAPGSSQQGRRSALSTVHSQAFSFSDVKAIKIDVKDKDTGTMLQVNFDLTQATPPATGWSGTIPALPKGKALTFTARALSSASPTPPPTVLFLGSTDQTLTLNNQSVSIALAPYNDGQSITLPRIVRISIPSAFISGQANNISFAVEGSTGENLKYALTAATSGGVFYPSNGSLTLAATAGTFVTQYLPPTVSVDTVFTHSVTVTNTAGNSVTTTFKTTVRPPGSVDSVSNTGVTVLFNPVINALNGSRVGASGDVVFTASVADDSPESQLTYAWSFTPTGSFTPAPTIEGTTRTGTLHNYTTALQGTLKVVVTDPDGGATSLFYPLIPNEFPDNPYVEGDSNGLNSIRAGASHTCALFNNGSLRCWGAGSYGQLGYGNSFSVGDASTTLPYTAGNVPFVGNAVKLAVGANHTCVLLDSGYVSCWGRNKYGQLGYNTTNDVGDSEAISSYGYVNLGGTATKITAGQNHTCALMDTGKVRCWGLNSSGQLGYGHKKNIGDDEQPWTQGDVQVGSPVIDIVAGAYHTCALLNTGSVRCWGANAFGQLGYGNTTTIGDDEVPSSVAAPVNLSGGNVLQIAAGAWHTCVLLDTGNIRCWGLNSSGQLGYGTTTDASAPGGDVNTGGKVLQVAAGSDHTCVLLESGNIKCWGYGEFGQLGYASATALTSPPSATVQLQGSTTAYQLTAGAYHTCALLGSGAVTCWGLNNNGQLGYGHTNNIGDNEQPSSAGAVKVLTP